MKTPSTPRDAWLARARQVSRRVNVAWWLETLAAPLLIAAIAGAAMLLVVRRQSPQIEPALLAGITVGAVLLLAGICWLRASRRFETPEQSLVRLEASMQLRNGLSAAVAGVAPWPEPQTQTHDGLRWNWQRVTVPPLGALALLAAGLLIPIAAESSTAGNAPDEPQAWNQLDAQLEHLIREEVADEPYLEELRKKLDELRAQEEEQWFSHASLEATDHLRQAHRSEVDRLDRELTKAANALEKLENGATGAKRDEAMAEIEQALQGLQNGAMKPNPQLLDQMRKFDPKNLGQLSEEQLQQLRENLAKHADAMKECQNCDGGEACDWTDELLASNGDSDRPGNGSGKGGVNRGPGHAPGVLGTEQDGTEVGELAGLEARDLSRSLPADLLQLQDGEHEVDRSATAPLAGGALQATGSGGERVWRESLDPDEQRTLKRFFE